MEDRKWTPRTAKCLCCNETHVFTRPKEFWECQCENHAMHDSGDGFYARTGAKDPKKIMVWLDGQTPKINKDLILYYDLLKNPNLHRLYYIKDRLKELKANANAIKIERKRLIEERKQIKEKMKNER